MKTDWCEFFLLLLFFPISFAFADYEKLPRDPRQQVTIVSDIDMSFLDNVRYYHLKRVPQPGIPGLRVSGLKDEVLVSVQDYEGLTGPRVKDLLARRTATGFSQSGSLTPIELDTGEKMIPSHYFLDPVDSYVEFRPTENPKDGWVYKRTLERIAQNRKFLLEAAPFLALTFTEDWGSFVKGSLLSMAGDSPDTGTLLMESLNQYFSWGPRSWKREANVFLNHEEYAKWGQSKVAFLKGLWETHHQRHLAPGTRPHYLIMLENDLNYLKEIEHFFTVISNSGVFSSAVIPILVNLAEPEYLANPNGTDWKKSALVSKKKESRVTIFYPNRPEKTNNLARVFEVALGLPPEEALKLFRRLSYSCGSSLTIRDKEFQRLLDTVRFEGEI